MPRGHAGSGHPVRGNRESCCLAPVPCMTRATVRTAFSASLNGMRPAEMRWATSTGRGRVFWRSAGWSPKDPTTPIYRSMHMAASSSHRGSATATTVFRARSTSSRLRAWVPMCSQIEMSHDAPPAHPYQGEDPARARRDVGDGAGGLFRPFFRVHRHRLRRSAGLRAQDCAGGRSGGVSRRR